MYFCMQILNIAIERRRKNESRIKNYGFWCKILQFFRIIWNDIRQARQDFTGKLLNEIIA